MTLYNCRSIPSGHRIAKFDDDINLITVYEVSSEACTCPAGVQPSCRHRKMLKRFIAAGAIDAHVFHNYEHNTWIHGFQSFADTIKDGEEVLLSINGAMPEVMTYYTSKTAADLEIDGTARVAGPPLEMNGTSRSTVPVEPPLPRISRRGF